MNPGETKKPLEKYSGRELTVFLLSLAAVGALMITLAVAPGLGLLIKYFGNASGKNRYRLARKIRYMEQNGYLRKHGKMYQPTEKGTRLLSEEEAWSESPVIPRRWDGDRK